jgi:hypothetical protein
MGSKRRMEEAFNAWRSAVLVEEDMAHLVRTACVQGTRM